MTEPTAPYETEFAEIATSPLECLLERHTKRADGHGEMLEPDVVVEWNRDVEPPIEIHRVLLYGLDITGQLNDDLKTALAVAIVKEEVER